MLAPILTIRRNPSVADADAEVKKPICRPNPIKMSKSLKVTDFNRNFLVFQQGRKLAEVSII